MYIAIAIAIGYNLYRVVKYLYNEKIFLFIGGTMSKTKIVNLSIIAVLLVVLIVANAICGVMAETIDHFLVGGAVTLDSGKTI